MAFALMNGAGKRKCCRGTDVALCGEDITVLPADAKKGIFGTAFGGRHWCCRN